MIHRIYPSQIPKFAAKVGINASRRTILPLFHCPGTENNHGGGAVLKVTSTECVQTSLASTVKREPDGKKILS